MNPLSCPVALLSVLVAVFLQGCNDCPQEEVRELSREEAIVKMLCTDAVAGELAKIETKNLDLLKSQCLKTIQNVTNLPRGKFKVEEHCEAWGSNHFLDTHAICRVFMHENCTKWAQDKMTKVENSTDPSKKRVKQLFDSADECLTTYGDQNTEDVAVAEQYYSEALKDAINQTDILIDDLKKKARDIMNEQLKQMGKFSMTQPVLPVVPTLRASSTTSVIAGALLMVAAAGLLALRLLRPDNILVEERSLVLHEQDRSLSE